MKQLITLENVFSVEECNYLIDQLEKRGFVQQRSGLDDRIIRTHCVFEDRVLADKLWSRMSPDIGELVDLYNDEFTPEPAVHQPLANYRAVGFNEFLRCYKYRIGEQFRRHEDFAHEWSPTKRTFLTVLVYLNDDFKGGETDFEQTSIAPCAGIAAVFPHELVHAGCPVVSGIKYTLRSDVVFSCEPK